MELHTNALVKTSSILSSKRREYKQISNCLCICSFAYIELVNLG